MKFFPVITLLTIFVAANTVNSSEPRFNSPKDERQQDAEHNVVNRPPRQWLRDGDGTLRLMAKYTNNEGKQAVIDASINVTRSLEKYNILSFTLSNEDSADSLLENPNILTIDNDYDIKLLGIRDYKEKLLNESITPYGISQVQSDLLPQRPTSDNTTIKVCVVDTGYALGHPDLPDLSSGYLEGIDTEAGSWSEDVVGHGSHVAGIIAAIGNNIGVTGINPSGSSFGLIIAKGLNYLAKSSDILDAVSSCVEKGAKVINLSLGRAKYSLTENEFYDDIYRSGVLVISASGNSGTTDDSYPASYPSVMSVGALNDENDVAQFSQFNKQVEISAPGVGILSTSTATLIQLIGDRTSFIASVVTGSPVSTVETFGMNCGLGYPSCPDANGKICIMRRGDITVAEKVLNCQNSGGVGAIIYNNVDGELYSDLSSNVANIPSVIVAKDSGISLLHSMKGSKIHLSTEQEEEEKEGRKSFAYLEKSGTSMSAPHVAGVAAKIWSYFPECSNMQIRNVLLKSAKNVTTSGLRCDQASGFGLVQAKDAYDLLEGFGCDAGGISLNGTAAVGGCDQIAEGEGKVCGDVTELCQSKHDCCSGYCRSVLFRSYCRLFDEQN